MPTTQDSLKEYGRGIAGGILFSLPMLYTMEVWWTGFLAHPLELLGYVAVSFFLLLGYNRFAGMRHDSTKLEVVIDSIEEMGLGFLIAAIILFVLGRITPATGWEESVGKVVVAAMTVAIGVSVGTAQLGGQGVEAQRADTDVPSTTGQLILAFCGAVLFAANVAPTEEILMVGIETPSANLLGLVVLSLAVGALILFQSDFVGTQKNVRRGGAFWILFGVVTSYAAALFASAMMLWFFRRFDGASTGVAVAQIVVLAFPAMLGASAGRLLIQ